MDAGEFMAIMMMLGDEGRPITQSRLAGLLWITTRQVRRYVRGETAISKPVAHRMRELAAAKARGTDLSKLVT